MIHNTPKVISLYLLLAILSQTNTANAWSPFGPANFEDCILANMKGVSSDSAASAIRSACRKKFPQESQQPSQTTSSRSGYPRVDVWDKPYKSKIFSNIKIGSTKYNQYSAYEIQITNKSNINLTGIYIGIPANKNTCSTEKSDYVEIYECNVDINSNTTKTAFCQMPKLPICISGLKAAFEIDTDKFFKNLAE